MRAKRFFTLIVVFVCFMVMCAWQPALAVSNVVKENTVIKNAVKQLESQGTINPVSDSDITYEENALREESIKHFRREDESIEAVVYPYPVHYKKNGEWTDIDNRLEQVTDESGKTVYRNKDGSFEVEFAADSNAAEWVKLSKDGYSISWRIRNDIISEKSLAQAGSERKGSQVTVNNGAASEDMRMLPNISSSITYTNAYDDTDITYHIDPTGIREFITIQSAEKALDAYAVDITCKGVTATADGNSLVLKNERNKEIFRIGAPFITDAAGQICTDVTLQLVSETHKIAQIPVVKEEINPVPEQKVLPDEPQEEIIAPEIPENDNTNENAEIQPEEQNTQEQILQQGLNEQSGEPAEIVQEEQPESESAQETQNEPEQITERPEAAEPEQAQSPTEQEPNNKSADKLLTAEDGFMGRIDNVTGLAPDDGKITFTYRMIPDKEWMLSEDRVWPITIDPDVGFEMSSSSIVDTTIYSQSNGNFNSDTILKIGSIAGGVMRVYMSFPSLPSINPSDIVLDSNLYLLRYANTSSSIGNEIDIHEITQSWDVSTLTWNEQPSFSNDVKSIAFSPNPGTSCNWDITELVKSWYNGENNYGVVLKNKNESSGFCEFYSADHWTSSYHPYLSVIYINARGLEDTWTYHSQSIGRAGTSYINDVTGGMTLVHSDMYVGGNQPMNIEHIFNGHEREIDIGFGLGWRLNLTQTVAQGSRNGVPYYSHVDADCTMHYYRQSASNANVYENELDKETTLTVSGNIKTISDKQGNKLAFDAYGRLYRIIDSNGNQQNIYYRTASKDDRKIHYISDSNYRQSTFYYNEAGRLSVIDCINGLDLTFTYDENGRLTSIKYMDNNRSVYRYDSRGYMTSARDYTGYKVFYDYSDATWAKVTGVREYANAGLEDGDLTGAVAGSSMTIAYGENSTVFTDNFGRKNIYQFNNAGQTIAVRDSDGSAQFCEFNSQDRMTTTLKSISKLQTTSLNLLSDHNMEDGTGWTFSNAELSTAYTYMGQKSLKIDASSSAASASQTVSVIPGNTYTFSAFLKGHTGGYISVTVDGAEYRSSGISNASSDWMRESVMFTVPDGVSSVAVSIKADEGIVYADCAMLEKSDSMNRYNLLTNGDLSGNASGWTRGTSLTEADSPVTSSDSTHPTLLDSSVYKLSGDTSLEKTVSQTVNISGNSGDCYTFGGWAKVNTIPEVTHNNTDYGVRKLKVGFVGSSETKWFDVSFNSDSSEWQYICGAAIAPFNYTSVIFAFEYTRNANEAFFDGMQLYKEEFSQSYTYDDDGNVISVQGLADKNSAFEYNGSNDLVKSTDAKGNEFNYTYDSKHNLLSATSASGLKYTFTYDSQGNALTSRVGSDTEYIASSATYTVHNGFMTSSTDARGKTVSYTWDQFKGLELSVTDPNSTTTEYAYGALNRLSSVTTHTDAGDASVSYTYSGDNLSSVSHNGFSYNLVYDVFGRSAETKVNNTTLSSNVYDNASGLLLSTTYGNGLTVSYEYDDLDRVSEVYYADTLMYSYHYDGEGALQTVEDHSLNTVTTLYYDLTGRLMRSVSTDGTEYKYEYDLNDNLTNLYMKAAGSSWTTSYTYDADNRPLTVNAGGKTITDAYNPTGTKASRTYGFSTPYTVALTYVNGANGSKTALPATYKNGSDDPFVYTYDDNGNISSIAQGTTAASYVYDDLNQLIRENDGFNSKTVTYTYDLAGNILNKKIYAYTTASSLGEPLDTVNYTYDTEWKDKLVSYDGEAITYDQIGNPLTYRGYNLTWQGRRLQALSGNNISASYTYNEEGLRTSKTVNNVVTNFAYNGSLLMAQTKGNTKLLFSYDAAGDVVSVNYNGSEYYYLRNAGNDVVALMDNTGQTVVQYRYDSWGKLTSTSGTLASSLGHDNPFRYRGYYYDTETGLYYVSSRYYDPEIGRWINADGYVSTGQGVLGYNMFAYCGNNPVNRKDPTGQFWITALIVTAVVAVCTVILSGCSAQPTKPSNYVQENSTNKNCYSYAFDLPHSANPGDYSVSGNSDYMFKDKNIYTPEEITGFIQRDMDALNKSVRVVDSPKDKLDNEYIVAMKTSTIVIPSIGVADYHFAVQLSDGSWADKPGQTPSRWNALDGAAIAWDLGNIKNYYNTETVYFAVER